MVVCCLLRVVVVSSGSKYSDPSRDNMRNRDMISFQYSLSESRNSSRIDRLDMIRSRRFKIESAVTGE